MNKEHIFNPKSETFLRHSMNGCYLELVNTVSDVETFRAYLAERGLPVLVDPVHIETAKTALRELALLLAYLSDDLATVQVHAVPESLVVATHEAADAVVAAVGLGDHEQGIAPYPLT